MYYKTEIEAAKKLTLGQYYELAYRAHTGISHSPEKQAVSYITEYSQELDADIEKLTEMGEEPAPYKERYTRLFTAWMSAKGNCISTMITGGSNFPVRRAEKANLSEHNRMSEFCDFRKNYFERIEKRKRKAVRDATDPLEEMKNQLEAAEKVQAVMTSANKIIRKHKTFKARLEALVSAGISERSATSLLTPNDYGGIGFEAWRLSNNSANIRRMKDRVKVLSAKSEAETKEVDLPGGLKVVQNSGTDRLQIFFPEKPNAEIIALLKGNGFKWAPSVPCWQRQLTNNAISALKTYILPKI